MIKCKKNHLFKYNNDNGTWERETDKDNKINVCNTELNCQDIYKLVDRKYSLPCINNPNKYKKCDNDKKNIADYVIVGMGAAGCVVARVLSDPREILSSDKFFKDQPNISVIGIEAGENQICEEPIRNVLFNGVLEEEYSANYFWQHDASHLTEGEEFDLQKTCLETNNNNTGHNIPNVNYPSHGVSNKSSISNSKRGKIYSNREAKNANEKTKIYGKQFGIAKIEIPRNDKSLLSGIGIQHEDGGGEEPEHEMEIPHAHNYTTGRIFGGGSSINGLQYVRPTPSIFNRWVELTKNDIWNPVRMTQYFIEIENYNGQTPNPIVHGFNGPLDIRQAPTNPTPIANTLTQAMAQAIGIPEIIDYNDPVNGVIGAFSRWQLFEQPNRERESSATAFLGPDVIRMTKNNIAVGINNKLKIYFGTTTTKLIWDNCKQKIIGVETIKDGNNINFYARKAVILCCGINNTQLLQLSGIGPADILQRRGIKVRLANDNVGRNLTNHPVVPIVFSAPEGHLIPSNDPQALYGPGAFSPNPLSNLPRGFQWIWTQSEEGQLILILILLNPLSRGVDRIQSNDPLKVTLTYEPQLSDPIDLQSYVQVIQTQIIAVANHLQLVDPAYNIITPSREVIEDTELLEQYILSTVNHTHHQGETNRMGDSLETGVVDGTGKVFGVNGLYIADDSIFPQIPDGNTTASAIIIGYTIAKELIKKQLLK